MSALNQQVQERKINEDVERQRNEAFGEKNLYIKRVSSRWILLDHRLWLLLHILLYSLS